MNSSHSGKRQRRGAWFEGERSFLVRHAEPIALGLLIVLTTLIQVAWILQDTRPQPGADPNHYLIKTFEFVDTIARPGNGPWWHAIPEMSLQGRPPLYQLASVPLIFLFGRSEDAALAINVLLGILLLLATYGIGKQAVNGKTGLLAAFLVSAYPPIIGLSTIYRPHAALPAWVALSVWLLLLLAQKRSVKVAWLFGGTLGLGMLIHLNFLYLLSGPTVLFGFYLLLFQAQPRYPAGIREMPRWLWTKLRDPFVLYGLLPAALIALGLAASWYVPQSQALLALQQAVSGNWVGEVYGFPNVPPSFWWYALTAPGAISYVLAAFLVLGVVVALLRRGRGCLILLVIFLTLYISLGSRLGDRAWLHFGPVLPVAAALTASGLADLRTWLAGRPGFSRLFATVLTLICAGAAAITFFIVTWGVRPWSQPIAKWLGAPLDTGACRRRMNLAFCPNPPRSENWQTVDILRVVVDDPDCQERGCRLVVVPKVDTVDAFVLDYHLLRDFPEYRSRVQVTTADGWGGIGADGEWVVSDYLLYIPDPRAMGTDRGKKIRSAVTSFLESPTPAFAHHYREVAAFALPEGWTGRLVKRTEPLTMDAILQICEEALASVPSDMGLHRKLGHLHLWAGNWSRADELFRQAVNTRTDAGWAHRALGNLYQRQGLTDRAVEEFQAAIEKEPHDPNAYRQLADLFVTQDDLHAAAQAYQLAVHNNPGLVWPHLGLGSLYVQAGRLAEAQDAYQSAARIEPWNREAQANLSNLYWSLASNLGAARAFADEIPLIWWQGEAWVRPYPGSPDVMVGRSVLEVEGIVQSDQILVHPFAADRATYFRFDVEGCDYEAVQVGYALADQVADLSNGAGYSLQASTDGGVSYTELWQVVVIENRWLSHTLSLAAYTGQDITFQLVVDALGDDGYDWLQTAVRFFPAPARWALATNLASAQVAGPEASLTWNGSGAWVDEDGRPLVMVSQAAVQGAARDNQLQFHPFSTNQDTILTFGVEKNPYTTLHTSYALADEAVEHSDGVDYAVWISTDRGTTYNPLLETVVSENKWSTRSLDLCAYQNRDLKIRLVSSSRQSESYDWLQITVDLVAAPGVIER